MEAQELFSRTDVLSSQYSVCSARSSSEAIPKIGKTLRLTHLVKRSPMTNVMEKSGETSLPKSPFLFYTLIHKDTLPKG